MLFILNDPNTPRREKNDMAKAAAPFCHPRLNAVEQVISIRATHEQRLAEIQAKLALMPSQKDQP